MARQKRSSRILQRAEKRQAALQSISPTLDLGNGLLLSTYSDLITTLRSQITTYNATLSLIDDQSRQIKATERQLQDLSDHMLVGVAAKYGKNSGEYGKAGGVRKSERRRPTSRQPIDSHQNTRLNTMTPSSVNQQPIGSNNGHRNGTQNGMQNSTQNAIGS